MEEGERRKKSAYCPFRSVPLPDIMHPSRSSFSHGWAAGGGGGGQVLLLEEEPLRTASSSSSSRRGGGKENMPLPPPRYFWREEENGHHDEVLLHTDRRGGREAVVRRQVDEERKKGGGGRLGESGRGGKADGGTVGWIGRDLGNPPGPRELLFARSMSRKMEIESWTRRVRRLSI